MIVANHCKIDPHTYFKKAPMKKELPEVSMYTREQFFSDIMEARNKGEINKALWKALSGSRFTSEMPLDARNKIIKMS